MAKKDDKKTKKPAKAPLKEEKPVENKKAIKEEKKANKKAEKVANKKHVKVEEKKVETKPEPKADKKASKTEEKNNSVTNTVKKVVETVKPKKVKEAKFEEKKDLDKLYVYFTIVNAGVADSVVKVFEDMGCSSSFVQSGVGTASEEMRRVLHIQDPRKEVVISIIRESRLEDIEKELAAFFLAAKRNKGVAFATKMDAIQGIRLYKFLSQTLQEELTNG